MFVAGIIMAGLIGWLSTQIVINWGTIGQTHHQMFSFVPQPALRPIPNIILRGVGANPTVSPLQVLLGGCLKIIVQAIIHIILLIILGMLVWLNFQLDMTQDFVAGILVALVIGFFLQQLRNNWGRITNLWSMIVNPPNPILSFAEPPNIHHISARPASPAFTVVFNNIIEISWRLILELFLLICLAQSLFAAIYYLREGAIRIWSLEH